MKCTMGDSTINLRAEQEGGKADMIKLDLQSRLPIYEQLKNKISELVMLGELKPDDQLPSVRSFARDLGVNPNTVQKAYQDLEREKIIYSVTGRGSYISPELDLDLQLRRQYLRKITQAAFQARQLGISEAQVINAVQEVYREESGNDRSNTADKNV